MKDCIDCLLQMLCYYCHDKTPELLTGFTKHAIGCVYCRAEFQSLSYMTTVENRIISEEEFLEGDREELGQPRGFNAALRKAYEETRTS